MEKLFEVYGLGSELPNKQFIVAKSKREAEAKFEECLPKECKYFWHRGAKAKELVIDGYQIRLEKIK